jgi:aspartate carbamoyltransferase catalytic subunit
MNRHSKIIGSIDDLSDGDINRLFFAARSNTLFGQANYDSAVLMTVFFEPSTRTRLSFEMAALRLSMGVVTFNKETSSLIKGEGELETINNILALKPDVLVIRSTSRFDATLYQGHELSVINGGDGINEHPTQALADCFTLLNHWQTDSFYNKRILIIGDLKHSRVAHSNIKLMSRLGARVSLLAPDCFTMTSNAEQLACINSFADLDGPIDAVMCLRVQKERMNEELLMNDQVYHAQVGLSLTRFLALGSRCVVLHPGPMNVGVEIDQDVAHHQRSLILKQVRNGVLMRSSLLAHCLG